MDLDVFLQDPIYQYQVMILLFFLASKTTHNNKLKQHIILQKHNLIISITFVKTQIPKLKNTK
jgi:uncharacterized membrane protein YbjE (DUF340 family)